MLTAFRHTNLVRRTVLSSVPATSSVSRSVFGIHNHHATRPSVRFFSAAAAAAPEPGEKAVHASTMKRKRSFNKQGQPKERLVIIGAGWGGYRLLSDIDTNKYSVSVLSPRNHFLFTPLLCSAAMGVSDISSICEPVRPLCAQKHSKFYEGRAITVDTNTKTVHCRTLDNRPFPLIYDKLVVACGFQANDFGIKDLDAYAFFMKETGDAQRVHDHILRQFEEASLIHILDGDENLSPEEEEQIRKTLSFVIVGGGPTGVEFSAELTDFLLNEISRTYPHLATYWKVRIIDALPSLLGPFQDKDLQEYARQHLITKQKVEVYLEEFVETVTVDNIKLKSGKSFDFSTLIWCAGIKPIPFVADLQFTKNERKTQLLTDGKLRVKDETDIFAVGDCGTIEDYWLPQTAQIAKNQAVYLAKSLNGPHPEKAENFVNSDRGVLAYLGGTAAVYKAPGPIPNLIGCLGWFTWRSAYWSMQLSMRNRCHLAWNWCSNMVFGRDLNRVGMCSDPVNRYAKFSKSQSQ